MTTFVNEKGTRESIRMVLHMEPGEAQVLKDLIETWLDDDGDAMVCLTTEWPVPYSKAKVESTRDYLLGKLKHALKTKRNA